MMTNGSTKLVARVTCPHCWQTFAPEEILFISEHESLLGDKLLGEEYQQRFVPTRFRPDGSALDPKGFPCRRPACPKCHLEVPRALLEMEPLFVSILGSPASGKSYFLGAMTGELRRKLPTAFRLSFLDTDLDLNARLIEYESSLFENPNPDDAVMADNLIRKTEETEAGLYDTVRFGSQAVTYPRPFLFSLRPTDRHPHGNVVHRTARVVCMYDNAGESFEAGKDRTSSPVTRHITKAAFLLFVFDPTQDEPFRAECQRSGARLPQSGRDGKTTRQEVYLNESAVRVRRHTGLAQHGRHKRPLLMVVTKADYWQQLLADPPPAEPWRQTESGLAALDLEVVERRSAQTRELLNRFTPELVDAAEGFCEEVVYIPVSALGRSPELDPQGRPRIQPRHIQPYWVEVPLLYGLARWSNGLVAKVRRKGTSPAGGQSGPNSRGEEVRVKGPIGGQGGLS